MLTVKPAWARIGGAKRMRMEYPVKRSKQHTHTHTYTYEFVYYDLNCAEIVAYLSHWPTF